MNNVVIEVVSPVYILEIFPVWVALIIVGQGSKPDPSKVRCYVSNQ